MDRIFDLNKAVAKFREKIWSHLILKSEGLHIWVTHDTILATFASRVLNRPLTLNQWPEYLDYLSIKLNNTKLTYLYSNIENTGVKI